MILLDIMPELIPSGSIPPMQLLPNDGNEGWQAFEIRDVANQRCIGVAEQAASPRHVVRIFQGKGGVTAVIEGKDLTYFGLPGSTIRLSDTTVSLQGEPIAGKLPEQIPPRTQTPPQSQTKQAMILGAGLATRFEPISGDSTGYPKPGVPLVGADSVIATLAKHLKQHGFTKLLVNTYYKPQIVHQQLGELDGMEVCFIDEDQPSGTAGGLVKALKQGLVNTDESVLIVQGDAVTDCDLSLLVNTHQLGGYGVTIGGQIVPDDLVHLYGIIETDAQGGDGQSGNITGFQEKPKLQDAGSCRFANAGFYLLSPNSFKLFLDTAETAFTQKGLYDYARDFFPVVLQQAQHGQMGFWAQALGGYWSDIGNPRQYLEALSDIYTGKTQLELPQNTKDYYENGVCYWPNTKSLLANEPDVSLTGPVVVTRPASTNTHLP